MWRKFQNNPAGRNVGDCAVRAVSVALGIDWKTAYNLIADAGFNMADMPSADATFGAVLRQHGFKKAIIPNECPNCYTAREFSEDNPDGIYVLGFGGHVATVVDGDLYDSWNSENEIPIYTWYKGKPPRSRFSVPKRYF